MNNQIHSIKKGNASYLDEKDEVPLCNNLEQRRSSSWAQRQTACGWRCHSKGTPAGREEGAGAR